LGLKNPKKKRLSCGCVTKIDMNRMAGWLERNTGKYAGGGIVTAKGYVQGGMGVVKGG